MNTKDIVEAKIRVLVPDLQTLEFGCEVKVEIGTILHGTSRTPNIKKFTVFRIATDSNYLYVTSEYDYSREVKKEDIIEILGKPIQLSDVLRAIGLNGGAVLTLKSEENLMGMWDVKTMKEVLYNLSLPFSSQEETVYTFLLDLLTN